MARETFVDTSGFYSLLVQRDDRHSEAVTILSASGTKRRRFLTTDYVLDETATLLKARGYNHLLQAFFDSVLTSKACTIRWTDVEAFDEARVYCLKHSDHSWSFTDCLSFVVMRKLRLREALTKDAHFTEAGYVALLA
jgi:hypothetical protein